MSVIKLVLPLIILLSTRSGLSQTNEWTRKLAGFECFAKTNIILSKQEIDSTRLRVIVDRLDILDSSPSAQNDEYKIWSTQKRLEVLQTADSFLKKQPMRYPLADVLQSGENVIVYYESIHAKPEDIPDPTLRKKYIFYTAKYKNQLEKYWRAKKTEGLCNRLISTLKSRLQEEQTNSFSIERYRKLVNKHITNEALKKQILAPLQNKKPQ